MIFLASRENKNNTGNEAQIAWESFEKDYLPIEEESEHTAQSRKPMRPWVRRLMTVAAVFVLLIGLSATVVRAFGWEKVWNAVAKWARETFSFVSDGNVELTEPSKELPQEYTSLQEALDATNQLGISVPTWIPNGYLLDDITIEENPIQRVYIAHYKNAGKEILVTVQSYLSSDLEIMEIKEDLLEKYQVGEKEYHIFNNNQQICAAWTESSYECYISGDLTLDEIKTMLNSIGKG